jgi:hypothetical protein
MTPVFIGSLFTSGDPSQKESSNAAQPALMSSVPRGSYRLIGSPCTYAYRFQLPGAAALLPVDGSAVLNLPVPTP